MPSAGTFLQGLRGESADLFKYYAAKHFGDWFLRTGAVIMAPVCFYITLEILPALYSSSERNIMIKPEVRIWTI